MGLTEDMAAGVVDRFRSLPMARSAVLVGRTAADLVVNGLTLVVMVLVGLAVGFRPSGPAYDLLSAFVLVLAFAYVFSWISAWVGLTVRDPETVQSAGFLWVLPLTFVSSAFVPTDAMPGAVQAFADVNPVTVAVDAARALTTGQGDALPSGPRDPRLARRPAARLRAPGRARVPQGLSGVSSEIDPRAPPPAATASPLRATLLGLARKATTDATSSAVTRRPIETPPSSARSSSSTVVPRDCAIAAIASGVRSVRVMPGCTTVTLTPRGPSSSARFFVIAETATLRIVPTTLPVWRAARPAMLTIRPQPLSTISGATARAQRR